MIASLNARLLSAMVLGTVAKGQSVGNWYPEVHPPLTTWQCTNAGGCVAQNTSLVMEETFRYIHARGSTMKCLTGTGALNATFCADKEICGYDCFLEGMNYTDSGVHTIKQGDVPNGVQIDLYAKAPVRGSRTYLLDEDGKHYKMLNLVGKELAFELEIGSVVRPIIAALYLVQMSPDGGLNKYNTAGAPMGTGYCDAQCPVRSFVNGTANIENFGVCCSEIDILEGSQTSNSLGILPCRLPWGMTCDWTAKPSGCREPEAVGCPNTGCHLLSSDGPIAYFGLGGTVDSSKKMTVVTQFKASTINGVYQMTGINRVYLQNGRVVSLPGVRTELNDAGCPGSSQVQMGGMRHAGDIMSRGMSLVLSIYVTPDSWLPPESRNQTIMDGSVTFTNIRWGEIGSTYTPPI